MFTRLPPGTVVPEWPGKSWDMVGDLVEQAGAQPNPNLVKFAANHPYVTAWVENESGADVTEFTPLKIKQPSFSYPDPIAGGEADESILNPQVLRVEEATSETPLDQLVFATQPIANNEAGLAIVFGVFPARVNIVSDSDTTCGVNPSELEKLKSGEGEIPIVWKPAGTGDKWCLVRLGGGGGTSNVSLQGTFYICDVNVPAAETKELSQLTTDEQNAINADAGTTLPAETKIVIPKSEEAQEMAIVDFDLETYIYATGVTKAIYNVSGVELSKDRLLGGMEIDGKTYIILDPC